MLEMWKNLFIYLLSHSRESHSRGYRYNVRRVAFSGMRQARIENNLFIMFYLLRYSMRNKEECSHRDSNLGPLAYIERPTRQPLRHAIPIAQVNVIIPEVWSKNFLKSGIKIGR